MKAFWTMTGVELKMCFRNLYYVFFSFIFPAMMLLIFGGIYGNDPSPFYGGVGSVDFSTPAYIAMIISVSGIVGLPLGIADSRSRKVLKRYRATPVSKLNVLAPQFVVNAIMCIVGLTILALLAVVVFGLRFHGGGVGALYFFLGFILSVAAVFSIGFLIAAIAPNTQAAMGVSFGLYFPMIFLSGSTIPLAIMPKALQIVSKALPLTYCVEILQGTWMGGPIWQYWIPIVVLSSITAVCLGLAIRFFKWE
jgi:Predicted membrane protein